MRGKILVKKPGGYKYKVKVRYLGMAIGLMLASLATGRVAKAEACPDVRVIFARGSGGEQDTSGDYLAFREAVGSKLATTDLSYDITDLEYPAVGVGFETLEAAATTLGAYISSGEGYEFGRSVIAGVVKLMGIVHDASCPDTKYVLGGYSQGAMVLLNTISTIEPDRLIYAATFGDPKIYLPEGKGLIPAACRGDNLSDYRMYVPDCQAYKGILGGYVPYEPETLAGKMGTWCNKGDILCSSHLSISDHVAYVSEGLYEDASRVIFDKICKTFGIENKISSPHDTAILIDSTGSMSTMIAQYKAEALRLAEETLAAGGRVALYDYRDLDDPYEPVKHCDFETCTLEIFRAELDEIQVDNGGDESESLLSASFHVMEDLNWKHGSTKSLVVLTDADFLSPDRDGMTFDEVVALSRQIDPVNFYIITNADYGDAYAELAAATDGKVVTNFDELSLLTDYIMERYDALPMVEENSTPAERPVLTIEKMDLVQVEGEHEFCVRVRFTSSSPRTIVALNGKIMGITEKNELIITGLNPKFNNQLALVPLGNGIKGETQDVPLDVTELEDSGEVYSGYDEGSSALGPIEDVNAGGGNAEVDMEGYGGGAQRVVLSGVVTAVVPKAPNTGAK